jgi:hypothetical protein
MIMHAKNHSELTTQKRVNLASKSFFFSVCFAILSSLFSTSMAFSHEVRPAYLELHQTSGETYDVLWKVPGQGEDLRLGLYVQLPESCSNLSQPRGGFAANAYTERWSIKCPTGLSGGTIRIAGLSATLTDVLVRLERLEGTTQVTRLTPAMPSFVVEAAPSRIEIVRTYLALGVEHILTGVDHLLFVLGLLLVETTSLNGQILRSEPSMKPTSKVMVSWRW